MHRKIKYSLFVWFLLGFFVAEAQYYITGQDPASIRWYQLNTPVAKIIFPKESEKMAQEYARLLQLSYQAVSEPYKPKMRQVDIVLHNRSTLSNAMVSPTPMHADYFLTPDQQTYAQPWPKQLTLHEYRHVVQMQKLRQGFGKGLNVAFGDQAIGALMGLFMPFWFIEGDAVFSETIYSQSGRGRQPEFMMDLKAQVIEKGLYSYDKAQYGSYRDYVPDHYTLGYQLVLYGLTRYNTEVWNMTLNKVARRPYSLMPFSNGVRQFAGVGKAAYYKLALSDLGLEWNASLAEPGSINWIPQPKTAHFTNYRFAFPLEQGGFIAEKSGMDDISRFVKIDNSGNEVILKTPGYHFAQSLSGNDTLIVWNEKTFDPRWTNRDYSVIKTYHTGTGKTKQLTRRTKLMAPSLSPDGRKIAAINVDQTNRYTLQWFSSTDGQMLGTFHFPENWFLITPTWAHDNESVVMVTLGEKGEAIVRYNTKSDKVEILVPATFTDIGQPILSNDHLVFKGAFNGVDNLYLKELKTGRFYQLTNAGYGVSDPAFYSSGDSLCYAEYTADGYRVATLDLSLRTELPINLSQIDFNYPVDALKATFDFNLDESLIGDTVFPVKKYSRLGHLFNFHSWGLTAVELNNYSFNPGVNILSQNVLSTSVAYAGYYFDPDEQTGKIKAGMDYMGWYPVISLTAETGRRSYTDTTGYALKWRETDFSASMSLPLNFTSSRWIKGIEPMAGVSATFKNMDNDIPYEFRENQLISFTYRFYGYIQYKRSLRDLFPRWGQTLQATFRHTPFSENVSQQVGIASVTWIPGLFNHHGIRGYAAYQKSSGNLATYANVISTPRGYFGLNFSEFTVLKADYAFPIAYPDWDIPSVMFLKRISGHLFFDTATGTNSQLALQTVSSTGLELFTDWHFLGLLPEITLGVRGIYLLQKKSTEVEFLFGFSF